MQKHLMIAAMDGKTQKYYTTKLSAQGITASWTTNPNLANCYDADPPAAQQTVQYLDNQILCGAIPALHNVKALFM